MIIKTFLQIQHGNTSLKRKTILIMQIILTTYKTFTPTILDDMFIYAIR
jgi:hypothetical protein